ncbi:MAG: T9SS type A sorting domain-containing protein [Flavobacterium sp.]|nr:T9SS type A sorting domain-containing protein [Flavobacterium sp.]
MIKKTLFFILLLYLPNTTTAQCWAKVAAGSAHTLAIKTDGTLWAWGYNAYGQLGIGNLINKNIPTQVGTDTDWKDVDASLNSMAQKTDGTLWTWGRNQYGELGNGTVNGTATDSGAPVTIPTLVNTDTDWVSFTSATYRCFAIKSNGTLWGWGKNNNSLGTNDNVSHSAPVQIGTATDWTFVDANQNYALALKSNHTLWGWGVNQNGGLSIGAAQTSTLVPTQTGNNTADWDKIAVDIVSRSKMIKVNGTAWAMGYGENGDMGNGTNNSVNNTPTQVDSDTDWRSIASGYTTLAIKNDNSLWAWGNNSSGQIGNGTTVDSNVPIQVSAGNSWSIIACGSHTLAIDSTNSLYVSGYNNYGQLGDGTTTNRITRILIDSGCNLQSKTFNEINKLELAPNPATKIAILQYNLSNNTLLNITITNNLGQGLFSEKINGTAGANSVTLNVENYAAGIYYVTLTASNQKETIKLIKQ